MRAKLPWIGIEPLINVWRGSPLRRAWQWWLKQLGDCIAQSWTRKSVEQLYHWPLVEAPMPTAASRPDVLLLNADQALVHCLVLPLAARSALDNVLAFELDRFTPFRTDQVHYVVHDRAVRAGRLHVTLVTVRREQMTQWLAAFARHGITLSRIDLLNEEGQRLGIQLIPGDSLHRLAPHRSRLIFGIGVLLVAVFTAMAFTLHDHEQALANQSVQVDQQRAQTRELQHLRRDLEQTGGAERYLNNLKQQQPTRAQLLAELSACLPATTWLQSLQINKDGQVDLAGFSANASSLINQIKQCPHLTDAQYQGIIQPDASSGKDRFYLRAQVLRRVEHVSLTVAP
jgi:general secretion pathway protein L